MRQLISSRHAPCKKVVTKIKGSKPSWPLDCCELAFVPVAEFSTVFGRSQVHDATRGRCGPRASPECQIVYNSSYFACIIPKLCFPCEGYTPDTRVLMRIRVVGCINHPFTSLASTEHGLDVYLCLIIFRTALK